jgi:CRP-like cAMP-binding protein
MVSIELLRRYPFFAGLSQENMAALARVADEISVETNHYFFHEDDDLDCFYLILEGAVAIVFELPAQDVKHTISEQLARNMKTRDVTISTVGSGDVFGWSGLVPPHYATAGAKAITPCHIVSFNCKKLMPLFEQDCQFGFLMVRKSARVIRDRLRDLQIESLASISETV